MEFFDLSFYWKLDESFEPLIGSLALLIKVTA